MKKLLRLKTMLLLCALMAGSGSVWAESVTLVAGTNGSTCTVNSKDGIKVGTSSKGGDMTIKVPANTTKLTLHAAAWKGVTGLSLNISGATASSASISLTADNGISNNSPFTLSGDEKDFVFEITLSGIDTETDIKFTSSIAKRFVVWGASAEVSGGGDKDDCDLELTDSPIALTFDLYNDDTKVISYTTSSTGAVSVENNDYVDAVVDAENKTITLTAKKTTSSAQTITVNQAADDDFKSGSATFTVSISDSTPFVGGTITFNATSDSGTSPLAKSVVTLTCSNGTLNNASEYRLFKSSVTTISTSVGKITKIVFTGVSGNPASGFGSQDGYTTDGNNGTWTGEATSVSFTASGAQVRATKIEVTVSPVVTLAASGYASYCSPFALDLTPTDDYAAYAVTATSGSSVTFSKIEGAVPAETPFILYGKDMGGESVCLPITTGETTAVSGNMLRGTLAETAITTISGDYTNFGLSNGSFVKISDGTLPANKAYLPILTANVPSNARLSIIFEDETTGISNVDSPMMNVEDYYNLAGQKVAQPTKGLYIVNGKKVIIK